MEKIDTNVSYGFWPFQPFPYQSLEALAQALKHTGTTTAWVSSVEAILAPDPALHEHALFSQLTKMEGLRPVKTANPSLAGEVERLIAFHHQYKLAAVKIYPSYHLTSLASPIYAQVAGCCEALGLPLLIVVRFNDERNQPPLMQVASVAIAEVIAFAKQHPHCQIIALGADKLEAMELAGGPENLFYDLSYIDGGSTLEELVERGGESRLLYGSNAPFFYPQAATLKLRYSDLPCSLIDRLEGRQEGIGIH